MKTCIRCHAMKETWEFAKDKKSRDGVRNVCCTCCNIARKLWTARNKNQPIVERPKCEFCNMPTYAEGGVCTKCSNEALKMFGDRINYHSETQLERRTLEIQRIRDSLKCVCSVETRIRMRKQLAAMEAMDGQAEEVSYGNGARVDGGQGVAVRSC